MIFMLNWPPKLTAFAVDTYFDDSWYSRVRPEPASFSSKSQ
jgi:hypothetical protein